MGWLSKTIKKAVKSVSKTFKAAGNFLTGKANSSDWLRLGGTVAGAALGYGGGAAIAGALGAGTSGQVAGGLLGGAIDSYVGKELGKGGASLTSRKKSPNLDSSASDAVSGVTAESGTGSGKDYEARRKAGFHYGRTLLS